MHHIIRLIQLFNSDPIKIRRASDKLKVRRSTLFVKRKRAYIYIPKLVETNLYEYIYVCMYRVQCTVSGNT